MDARKVMFSLAGPQDLGFDPDMTEGERKQSLERQRQREGLLHAWQDVEMKSPSSDNYLVKKVALIEDVETGRVHEVSHEYFNFINE